MDSKNNSHLNFKIKEDLESSHDTIENFKNSNYSYDEKLMDYENHSDELPELDDKSDTIPALDYDSTFSCEFYSPESGTEELNVCQLDSNEHDLNSLKINTKDLKFFETPKVENRNTENNDHSQIFEEINNMNNSTINLLNKENCLNVENNNNRNPTLKMTNSNESTVYTDFLSKIKNDGLSESNIDNYAKKDVFSNFDINDKINSDQKMNEEVALDNSFEQLVDNLNLNSEHDTNIEDKTENELNEPKNSEEKADINIYKDSEEEISEDTEEANQSTLIEDLPDFKTFISNISLNKNHEIDQNTSLSEKNTSMTFDPKDDEKKVEKIVKYENVNIQVSKIDEFHGIENNIDVSKDPQNLSSGKDQDFEFPETKGAKKSTNNSISKTPPKTDFNLSSKKRKNSLNSSDTKLKNPSKCINLNKESFLKDEFPNLDNLNKEQEIDSAECLEEPRVSPASSNIENREILSKSSPGKDEKSYDQPEKTPGEKSGQGLFSGLDQIDIGKRFINFAKHLSEERPHTNIPKSETSSETSYNFTKSMNSSSEVVDELSQVGSDVELIEEISPCKPSENSSKYSKEQDSLEARKKFTKETENEARESSKKSLSDNKLLISCEIKEEIKGVDFSEGFEDLFKNGSFLKKYINKSDEKFPRPEMYQRVFVDYKCMAVDWKVIEEKQKWFVIGEGDVVTGLDLAVQDMRIGDEIIFKISPRFGYADFQVDFGSYTLPPNSELIFRLKLLDFTDFPDYFPENYQQILDICEDKRNLGNFYYKMKNFECASICYSNCLRHLSKISVGSELANIVRNNFSAILINEKKFKQAIEMLEKVYENNTSQLKVLYRLAMCYENVGEFEKALGILEKAFLIDKDKSTEKWLLALKEKVQKRKAEFGEFSKRMFSIPKVSQVKSDVEYANSGRSWKLIGAVSGALLLVGLGIGYLIKLKK